MNARDTTGRHLKRLRAEGVSVWLRGCPDPGEDGALARLAADWDLSGVTWTVEDVLAAGGGTRFAALRERGHDRARARRGLSALPARAACDALLPRYEASRGRVGLVSADLPPTDAPEQEGLATWWAVDRPNLLVKVPGTPDRLDAVAALVAAGVGVDVTPVFSAAHHERVLAALSTGLERAWEANRPLSAISTAVTVPVAPIDRLVDRRLRERGLAARRYPIGESARAHARLVYHLHEQVTSAPRWQRLASHGAQFPHLVWTEIAPAGHPAHYADGLVGWGVVHAFGRAELASIGTGAALVGDALSGRHITARQDLEALYAFGLSYEELAAELEQAWLAADARRWQQVWEGTPGHRSTSCPAS
ncbi:transaldolase family protein [Streptomyces sp. NPDC021969]|uniref:transaldolase family protein n=1 Tax=unclassified Streptomyces TaxID=2593676 RepID=UPI0033DE3B07